MRLRLLPLVIVVAGITLAVRLDGIWQGVEAMAEAPQTGTPIKMASAGGTARTNGAGTSNMVASNKTGSKTVVADAGSTDKAGDHGSIAKVQNLPADPFKMTDSDIELLQALSKRRKELDKRAKALDAQKALLAAAEKRIDQKAAELKKLQSTIKGLLSQYDKKQEKQIQSLVKIYSNMKPRDAARIFDELDTKVLLRVIDQMKERKSAPIIAQMKSEKAKEITIELAKKRALPVPGQ
jgi:flagellar motility protein MotE (MotC chaperone)